MFETAILSAGPQTKRVWTTLLGIGGQALLVTGLVLVPLCFPQSIPKVVWSIMTVAPPPPLPPPVPVAQVIPRMRVAPTRIFDNVFRAPIAVPQKVEIYNDLDNPPVRQSAVVGGIGDPNGVPGMLISEIIGPVVRAIPRPVAEPTPVVRNPVPTAETKPPRITQLQMAEPIQRTQPIYPAIARAARIAGKVELMGVLGVDGRIHEVKVLSGHPLLVKAAVDAVMQWVYRPTILNGQPVEVQAPIQVNFILN